MLTYHKTTEEEKYLIADWKYCGDYVIYNNQPYEEQKKSKSGFANPKNNFYSFYEKTALIGFINLHEEKTEVFFGIGVNPDACNKGYGKQMIQIACEISKSLFGEKPLYLEVRTWNKRAIRCYEKAGFHIEGEDFRKITPVGEGVFYRMVKVTKNYYGSLCTELYEILHKDAPEEELNFYLSYAKQGMKMLEPLCGSGRFFIPFMERHLDIFGVDLSKEMLQKLIEKQPEAKVVQGDLLAYSSEEKFDYIFITSGSVSLFTDIALCKKILSTIKRMLAPKGKFVFAVDTVANICPEDTEYRTDVVRETKDGYQLILKTKNHYDVQSQTQFSPGLYELYHGDTLVQRERMDFQTHLYKFGEMEQYLREIGFSKVKTYASFSKELAASDKDEMFLFECME